MINILSFVTFTGVYNIYERVDVPVKVTNIRKCYKWTTSFLIPLPSEQTLWKHVLVVPQHSRDYTFVFINMVLFFEINDIDWLES